MAKIAKTHLWMGITSKGKIEFEKYFEIDYSDEGSICQFCQDIGLEWYDEDFFGLFGPYTKNMSIEQALKKTVICEKEYDSIKKIIETKGLQNVNAFFYYQDEEIRKIDKSKIYNDLHYIGEFEKLSYG